MPPVIPWTIARAKAGFSDLVQRAAREPQVIYNRTKPVAAMISAEDIDGYLKWRAAQGKPTMAERLDELERICEGESFELELVPRTDPTLERPNAFLQVLKEEMEGETPAARDRSKRSAGKRSTGRARRK